MQTGGSQKSHSETSESILYIHEKDLLLNTYDTCRLTNYNETGSLLIHWLPTRVWQSPLFAIRWNLFFFFSNMEYVSYRPFVQQWISPLISLPLHAIPPLLQLFAQCGLFPSLLLDHTVGSVLEGHSSHLYPIYIFQFFLKNIHVWHRTNSHTDVTIHSLGVYLNFIRWEKAALLPLVF